MDNIDVMLEPTRAFLMQVGTYTPRLLMALAVLVAGWLIARAARFAVTRALRAMNFNVMTERAGIDSFLAQGGVHSGAIGIFGELAWWLVILATLAIAFNSLGLTYVTDVLGQLFLFVPRLVIALLIMVFGAYFARFVSSAVLSWCNSLGMLDAALLSRLTRIAVLVFVVLIALDQVGIGGTIVRESFLVILAGAVFALALAFGLGARERAARLLDRWWPQSDGENDDRNL